MHSTDDHSLFQEIEADLQRQKYENLWRRFGPYVLGGAVLIVVLTAGVTFYRSFQEKQALSATLALEAVLANTASVPEDKIKALETFSATQKGTTQDVFAKLHQAGLLVGKGQKAEAIALYDALAADEAVDPLYRQLADLLSVQTGLDQGDPAALTLRLERLKAGPWGALAHEYLGHLALKQGEKAKAIEAFRAVGTMENAPYSLTQRAKDMLDWLEGEK